MKKYRHYKGCIYDLLHVARHTETKEKLVIYKSEDDIVYARPYDMFFDKIKIDGVEKQRFEEINDES